jgi:hypothetical protein
MTRKSTKKSTKSTKSTTTDPSPGQVFTLARVYNLRGFGSFVPGWEEMEGTSKEVGERAVSLLVAAGVTRDQCSAALDFLKTSQAKVKAGKMTPAARKAGAKAILRGESIPAPAPQLTRADLMARIEALEAILLAQNEG